MDIALQIIFFLSVGILTGLLSGLLGIGGGVISVPAMVFLFHIIDHSSSNTMQMAIGSSLAAIIFTSFSSARSHNLHKRVHWPLIKKIIYSVILGAITGTYIVHFIPSEVLQKIFGIFEATLGVYFFFLKSSKKSTPETLPNPFKINAFGYTISTISTLFGMGGSFLSVPAFVHFKLPIKKAIGTSTVISFTLSSVATAAFLIPGFFTEADPYSLGYIYLPAFIPMSIASFSTAPIGAKLIQYIPTRILKKIFAILIIAMGILMIFKG